MINAWVSKKTSSVRTSRKLAMAIESLEPRSYLSGGVVFSGPINAGVAATGTSYVNLDNLSSSSQSTHDADLITANVTGVNSGSVSILPSNAGSGRFNATAPIPLDFKPLTIRTGVLNGREGIVVGSTSTNGLVGVIEQDTSGTFTETDYTATGLSDTQSVAIGDFNGDGHVDFAVASDDPGTSNNVAIFLNNGSGGFLAPTVLSVPHSQLSSITTFTENSGRVDLAVSDAAANAVTVLTNDGNGNFGNPTDYPLGQNATEPITITDGQFNKLSNTNDDLVTANGTSGNVSVLLANGDGTFQTTAITTAVGGAAPGGGPLKVRVANLNADQFPDLISLLSSGSSGDAEVLLGNGDGTFHVGNVINTGQGTQTAIAAGDLNGDGLTDMVLANGSQVTSLLNTTNQDTSAPTASVDVTQPTVTQGAAAIDFTVTYTDAQQIDASTLSGSNVTVVNQATGANEPVSLVSSNLGNASSVTATYSIPPSSTTASPADNGTYLVTTTSDTTKAVKNANGVPVAGASIGQFVVTVTTVASNGPDLVAGAVVLRNPAAVVGGARYAGPTRVTVLNSGNQLARGKIVISLYASPDQTIRGGTPVLVSVTRNVNLKPGKQTVFGVPGFKWPTTPGTYFILANVNATQSLTETNYSDNVGISATPTVVAAPFVNIQNLWTGKLPATLKVGRRASLAVLLKNAGNVAARATAAFTIQAMDSAGNLTPVGTGTVRVAAPANGRQFVALPLTLPSTLASGTYHLLVTVSYPGDTNAGDDTATSATTFTV